MKYASVPLQKGVDLGYVKIIDKKLLHKGLRQNWRPGLTKPNVTGHCIYGHAAVLGNIWKPPRERERDTQRDRHAEKDQHTKAHNHTHRQEETQKILDPPNLTN